MKKVKIFTLVFLIVFNCLLFQATTCKELYFNLPCEWYSEEPYIYLERGCSRGQMTIDGITYDFFTILSNNATYIAFEVWVGEQREIFWEASTVYKNDILYLKITTDNISNYKGKTIKMYKR